MSNHRRAIAVTVLLLGLFVVPASAFPRGGQAAGATPLSNDDIVKMVQAKLPDAVIIAKIKASECKFDRSTDALIKLPQSGVSGPVLSAMAEGGAAVTPAPSGPPPDPNDPASPHDPGIYYVRQNPGGRRMSLLEPSVYSGGKTSGVFTMAMTHGISHAK